MTNFKLLSLRGSTLIASTLIAVSMANAAMASEHHIRHHKAYAKTYTSETVRNAFGSYSPTAVSPEDQNAFGTVSPWKSGMQPDDWRQSVNGN
jgi:hypothetical protein